MPGKTSLFTIVSVLALALPSVNAFATVGCYPAGAVTSITTGLLTVTTTGITTPQACADRTEEVNRLYAYFDGNTDTCYSTNLQPLLSATTDSVSTIIGGVGETICNPGDLQGLDVTTPYTDFGCALPVDLEASGVVGGLANPLAISSCLRVCEDNGYRFSFITNLLVGNTCQCAQAVTIVNAGICGLGRSYVYVDESIAPSGVARRRLAEQKKRAEITGPCPSGLQACRVNQGEFATDDFECLDVQAELESCGGCTQGLIEGDSKYATSGVDCTAVEGVEMGAVSCVSGQCQISQCRRGYALVDNTCVSTRSVAAMALGALRLQNL